MLTAAGARRRCIQPAGPAAPAAGWPASLWAPVTRRQPPNMPLAAGGGGSTGRVQSAQQPARESPSQPMPPASSAPELMYEHALELSRREEYGAAREAFEALLSLHPTFCKAWVSYAQMEKRMGRLCDPLRMAVARQILQRGLTINPDSGCLAQAWGLMELQKGNTWAAVRLLERCVDMDPFLNPVLRWKPVSVARMTVAGSSALRRSNRRQRGAVACAAASAGGGAAAAPGGSGSAGTGAPAAAAAPAGGAAGAAAAGGGGNGGSSAAAGGVGGGSSGCAPGGCMSSM